MNLVYYPHPALLKPIKDIQPDDFPDLKDRIAEMFEIMYGNKGIGLAAPQVAWSVNLCLVNPTLEKEDELVLINPKITSMAEAVTAEEGCLSFPGIYARVKRAKKITVEYQDADFQNHTLECEELLARVVQHEVDHLDNLLITHRMSKADKFKNRKKLKQLQEEFSQ